MRTLRRADPRLAHPDAHTMRMVVNDARGAAINTLAKRFYVGDQQNSRPGTGDLLPVPATKRFLYVCAVR